MGDESIQRHTLYSGAPTLLVTGKSVLHRLPCERPPVADMHRAQCWLVIEHAHHREANPHRFAGDLTARDGLISLLFAFALGLVEFVAQSPGHDDAGADRLVGVGALGHGAH